MQTLHERVSILHERDVDYDIRLHNAHVFLADARSKRDGYKSELAREVQRREDDRIRWGVDLDRIRNERNQLKVKVEGMREEIRALKAKDPETVEGMWQDCAREDKVQLRPVPTNVEPSKRKRTADDDVPGPSSEFPHDRHLFCLLITRGLRVYSKQCRLQSSSIHHRGPRCPHPSCG